MCCSVLQCIAVYCSALQCVAVCCSVLQCVIVCYSVLQCVSVCSSVFQYIAECWGVLHYIILFQLPLRPLFRTYARAQRASTRGQQARDTLGRPYPQRNLESPKDLANVCLGRTPSAFGDTCLPKILGVSQSGVTLQVMTTRKTASSGDTWDFPKARDTRACVSGEPQVSSETRVSRKYSGSPKVL